MAFVRTDTGSKIVANHRASGPMGVAFGGPGASRQVAFGGPGASRQVASSGNYHCDKPQSEARIDRKVCSQRNFQNL